MVTASSRTQDALGGGVTGDMKEFPLAIKMGHRGICFGGDLL